MESGTKNTKSRMQLEAMTRKSFGGIGLHESTDAVRELKDGWFNAAYALRLADEREVVLKIAPAPNAEVMSYELNIMSTEVAAMRLVGQATEIPVPRILFHDDSRDVCDADYFFMEKIDGDNLDHVYEQWSAQQKAVVDQEIGAIIRKVNAFPGTYFGYPGNPDLRAEHWIDAFQKIMDSVFADAARKSVGFDYTEKALRAALDKHIETLKEVTKPCLVHWDAWRPNFFVKDGHIIGIIDFERALWAEPLMEAQFRSLCWGGGTESLKGYGKTEFTPNELRRCWLYLLHLALVMHVECYYRHYGTDKIFKSSRKLIDSAMSWLHAN